MKDSENFAKIDDLRSLIKGEDFSDAEIAQIDAIDNAVWNLCEIMADGEMKKDWDMEIIGEIAEFVQDVLRKHEIHAYYPYRMEEE